MPETHRGTILAFDFGIRRIGVAVGEPETGTAHPLPGIAVGGDARFAAIGTLVAQWQPSALVVGLPLAANGSAHEMTRRAERFEGVEVARQDFAQRLGNDSLVILANADELRTARVERGRAADVRRHLDCDDVTRIQQRVGDEIERLLRAGRDDHVVGAAVDRASPTDRRDLVAQSR